MISVSDGDVILEIDEEQFILTDSSSYSKFLLWITNPDPDVVVARDSFAVAEALTGEERERAQRYADFLDQFVEKRKAKLDEFKNELSFDVRRREIENFISALGG